MKARNCSECANFTTVRIEHENDVCTKGHRPRFYYPRNYLDIDWGWKRRCAEFTPKEER